MKIIKNKIIPFGKNFYAINLFGVLFIKGPYNKRIINHESIHSYQIRELGYIFFYIFYLLEWLFRLFQYGNYFQAYYNISFEREAYANETDENYLINRRLFSFWKYIRKKM